jgi:hypothetical protein
MESRHAIFIASLVTEEKLHVFYSHLVFPWNPVGKIRGTHLVSLLRLVRMQSCFFNCVQSSSQRCSFFLHWSGWSSLVLYILEYIDLEHCLLLSFGAKWQSCLEVSNVSIRSTDCCYCSERNGRVENSNLQYHH